MRFPLATAEPFRVPTALVGQKMNYFSVGMDSRRSSPATYRCSSEDTKEHAYGLLRVIDDDGKRREWNPHLDSNCKRA